MTDLLVNLLPEARLGQMHLIYTSPKHDPIYVVGFERVEAPTVWPKVGLFLSAHSGNSSENCLLSGLFSFFYTIFLFMGISRYFRRKTNKQIV